MKEFSFLIDDSDVIPSDIRIGPRRSSETFRTWNDSELKSIVSGTEEINENCNASIVSICEGRGPLSEIGIAIFETRGSFCHVIQVKYNMIIFFNYIIYDFIILSMLIHQIIQGLCIY